MSQHKDKAIEVENKMPTKCNDQNPEHISAMDLLPCPFCAGEPELIEGNDMDFYVSCENCDARAEWFDWKESLAEEKAMLAWNKRA